MDLGDRMGGIGLVVLLVVGLLVCPIVLSVIAMVKISSLRGEVNELKRCLDSVRTAPIPPQPAPALDIKPAPASVPALPSKPVAVVVPKTAPAPSSAVAASLDFSPKPQSVF